MRSSAAAGHGSYSRTVVVDIIKHMAGLKITVGRSLCSRRTIMNDEVAIVGSGLVGRAWAISFARGGHDVVLFDTDDKAVVNALRTVESLLAKLELTGMLSL
jgi:NADPH-dependent 2,4-dienoyl-CoA reductase/sulfur reductase-like enzyme